MRAVARRALDGQPRWRLVAGRAEATGLADACVDAVTAAQAFHWFEPDATRAEFRRVLRPGGLVALVWTDRDVDGCPMLAESERLLRAQASAYAALERRGARGPGVHAYFASSRARERSLPHVQRLPWEGVAGRSRSASYVPREGPDHDALFAGLRAAFERHARDGLVELRHVTRVYVGRLDAR
jgi:SAM-dependent methyltransferase